MMGMPLTARNVYSSRPLSPNRVAECVFAVLFCFYYYALFVVCVCFCFPWDVLIAWKRSAVIVNPFAEPNQLLLSISLSMVEGVFPFRLPTWHLLNNIIYHKPRFGKETLYLAVCFG